MSPGPARAPPRPRAMVLNRCRQIKVVLCQLLPALQSQEERERKVAILILTEVGPGRTGAPQRPSEPFSSCLSAPSGHTPGPQPDVGKARPDRPLTSLLPTLGLPAGSPTSQGPHSPALPGLRPAGP